MTFKKGESGNPVGMRRKTLTDEQIALVEKLATRGSHEHTFAFHLGISTPTWRRMREHDKRVRAAYERGRGRLHDYCFGRMLEHSERTFVPAWIVLKSVFGYREDDPVADNGPRIVINLPSAASLASYQPPVIKSSATPALEPMDAKR